MSTESLQKMYRIKKPKNHIQHNLSSTPPAIALIQSSQFKLEIKWMRGQFGSPSHEVLKTVKARN